VRISELAAAVVRFVSGDVMVEAIRELNALTVKASGYLKNSAARIEASIVKLQTIAESINEVHEHIETMNRLTRNLYKLGFFTKIENSSLKKTEKGLESLGEDVRLLSESIIGKNAKINENMRILTKTIIASLSRIRALGETQQIETSAVIETTIASISSLTEKYRLSAGVANGISSTSDEMSKSIWDIVTSVQFHDITRQQFEHSKRRLDAILKGIGKTLDGTDTLPEDSGRGMEEIFRDIDRFCISEPSQLRHTRAEFTNAIKNVMRNLGSVSEKMKEMLGKTRTITGDDFSSGSFLIEIEDVLSAVTSTISVLAGDTTVMKELSEVITLAVSTAQEMLEFADEIEEIGDDVGLLAINAAATARRIGDEGRPFSVIADSISHISSEASVHAESISGTLKAISAFAEELWKDTSVHGEAEIEDTSANFERLIGALHSVNREMAQAFKDIEESERTLSGEIEEIIIGTNIHAVVDRATEEILSLLEETASEIKIERLDATVAGARRDSNREIKEAGERTPSSSYSLSAMRIGSGEFGDNVDLF
jgi:methyl-accepting chemotaxis protein